MCSFIRSFEKRNCSAVRSETTRSRSIGPQPLGGHLALLRRVQAHPDLLGVGLRLPELQELFDVSRPFDLLPRHGAMDGDVVAGDVFEDAVVGGRRPPGVVLGLQAVDRHDNLQPPQAAPADRNLAHGARHELRVDAAGGQDRQQRVELAIPDQRFAADDRQVQRAMAIHEPEHAVDEGLALEVAQLAQAEVAAQVIVAVRIAAGAMQRALARDLDRERGRVASEYPSPGLSGSLPRRPPPNTIVESRAGLSLNHE
mgnify:CR=1 FL=1